MRWAAREPVVRAPSGCPWPRDCNPALPTSPQEAILDTIRSRRGPRKRSRPRRRRGERRESERTPDEVCVPVPKPRNSISIGPPRRQRVGVRISSRVSGARTCTVTRPRDRDTERKDRRRQIFTFLPQLFSRPRQDRQGTSFYGVASAQSHDDSRGYHDAPQFAARRRNSGILGACAVLRCDIRHRAAARDDAAWVG